MKKLNESDTIFLVDDDRMIANIYAQHIENLGYKNVKVFENGQDCINQLIEEPQIIFLDQHMDFLQGIEVLRKIKRFDPGIYVVFISGQEDIETAINSLKYGAFDYIIKGKNDLERIEEVLLRITNLREQLSKRGSGVFRRILSLII